MTTALAAALAAWPDLLLAVAAGPLLVAGAAKLAAAPRALSWPIASGPLGPPHGPRIAGALEAGAALAALLLPGRPAAAAVLAAYAVLAVFAYRMRGRRCACFGAARLASVGRTHIGANGAAALAGAVALLAGPGQETVPRAAAAALAAAATVAAVVVLDRRRAAAERSAAPCADPVSGVRLYVSEHCPSCRSLKALVAAMEPDRRGAVSYVVVERDAELPDALQGHGVPCALGLDAAGSPVCAPASGIGGVKALIDTITLSDPAADRVG